ncbi:uncharacterized protein METZ01_LOCUS479954, partial [marine metagenome]
MLRPLTLLSFIKAKFTKEFPVWFSQGLY